MHYEHCQLCLAGIIILLLCFQFYLSLPYICTYITMGTPQDSDMKDIIIQSLYAGTLGRDLNNILMIYGNHPVIYATKITKSGDTVLHVTATRGDRATLVQLLDTMEKKDRDAASEALQAKNNQGDSVLHCAARRGSLTMCERIVGIFPSLVLHRNNERETPLFLAALLGHKETFLYLHSVTSYLSVSTMSRPWRRRGGDSILHCTIREEHFDLAFDIIHLYKDQFIVDCRDENGSTPLHVLASKPSAFQSSTRFRWWTKILYYCIVVDKLKFPDDAQTEIDLLEYQSQDSQRKTEFDKTELPKNYRTCHDFFKFLWDLVQSVIWKGGIRRSSETEAGVSTSYKKSFFPLNYATCFEFFKSSCNCFLDLSGIGFIHIKKIKQKHVWCAQIIGLINSQDIDNVYDNEVVDEEKAELIHIGRRTWKKYSSLDDVTYKNAKLEEMDERMTPLLTAAKNGMIEFVNISLQRNHLAIHDNTSENKNILHVAAENRQPHIFKELKKKDEWESLILMLDVNGNNVLHLAAKEHNYKPWQRPGSAVEMQWETKWYQFVKEQVPRQLTFQTNKEGQTPGDIFHESHEKLLQEGRVWLKSTSESCSVVAALIAGVAFATSSSVPGGTDDQTGKPTLEGQPAFNVFAIASLVALCFSITALIMFLAILSSRQQAKDFRRNLPFKLLLGLSSLFVSIASILISFCAAHFFVLRDELSKLLFVIYTAPCLPVLFYTEARFSLYLDLLEAIISEVPQPKYKEDDL